MIECPNHEGNFDCTPFCQLCEGNQEYFPIDLGENLPSQNLPEDIKNITLTPRDLINLGTWLLEQETSGLNMALAIDCLASPEMRDTAARL